MENLTLSKEVSGRELVDILRRACTELRFSFENLNDSPMFRTEEPEASATYKAKKRYPDPNAMLTAVLANLGHSGPAPPVLSVSFPDIDENARYSSVRYGRDFYQVARIHQIGGSRCEKFESDYKALLAKIVELSGE